MRRHPNTNAITVLYNNVHEMMYRVKRHDQSQYRNHAQAGISSEISQPHVRVRAGASTGARRRVRGRARG